MSNLSIAKPSPIYYGEVAFANVNSNTFTSANLFLGTSKVVGLKAFLTASVTAAKAGNGALVPVTPAGTLQLKSITTTNAGVTPFLATGTVVSSALEGVAASITVFVYWTNETNNDPNMLNA